MFSNAATWYHTNRYTAQSACQHCGGIVRHERWCMTLAPNVQYAFGAVLEPEKLSLWDRLILHALGVSWGPIACPAPCSSPNV
jgi:hypothetical protein